MFGTAQSPCFAHGTKVSVEVIFFFSDCPQKTDLDISCNLFPQEQFREVVKEEYSGISFRISP